jgi:hypothetical protein
VKPMAGESAAHTQTAPVPSVGAKDSGRTAGERLVIALGGNALLRRGDRGTAVEQEARSMAAMDALAPLLTPERQVVITHGNGPIVGNMLIRHQLARHLVPPYRSTSAAPSRRALSATCSSGHWYRSFGSAG